MALPIHRRRGDAIRRENEPWRNNIRCHACWKTEAPRQRSTGLGERLRVDVGKCPLGTKPMVEAYTRTHVHTNTYTYTRTHAYTDIHTRDFTSPSLWKSPPTDGRRFSKPWAWLAYKIGTTRPIWITSRVPSTCAVKTHSNRTQQLQLNFRHVLNESQTCSKSGWVLLYHTLLYHFEC